jgi:hypothetical protein
MVEMSDLRNREDLYAIKRKRRWWLVRSTAAWRTFVQIRASSLKRRLSSATPPTTSATRQAWKIVRGSVKDAKRHAMPPRSITERWFDWYSGASIEKAWAALHEGEIALMTLESKARVKAWIPRIRALLESSLDPSDARRRALAAELDHLEHVQLATWTSSETEALQFIQRDTYDASDDQQRGLRRFRNLLGFSSSALVVLLIVLAVIHTAQPHFISLCIAPAATAATTNAKGGAPKQDLCAGGSDQPTRYDLFEVELVGALGGLLAGILVLARLPTPRSPYNLPSAQLVLKVVAGAGTALLGIALLQSGVFSGFIEAQPGSHVIGYAALFGFSQQLLTGLVDKRASQLLPTS